MALRLCDRHAAGGARARLPGSGVIAGISPNDGGVGHVKADGPRVRPKEAGVVQNWYGPD